MPCAVGTVTPGGMQLAEARVERDLAALDRIGEHEVGVDLRDRAELEQRGAGRRHAVGAFAEAVDLGLAGVVEAHDDTRRDLCIDQRLHECRDGIAVSSPCGVTRGLQGGDGLPGRPTTGGNEEDDRDQTHRRRLKGMRAVCNRRQRV